VTSELAAAYTRSAETWAAGPQRIYGALAEELVGRAPIPLSGALVADVGAGRGAATHALLRVGARPVAFDLAEGMLAAGAGAPAAVADSRALPVRDQALDGVVAAFTLNHLAEPALGLREARRATRPGGCLLVSAYAAGDTHPVKAAVDDALRAEGWTPPPWYAEIQRDAVPQLASVARAAEVAAAAGLAGAVVAEVERAFPDLGSEELVDWRLGMAMAAPFLEAAGAEAAARARARALDELGPHPEVLVRHMVVIAAVVS
jgi:ubiquinone/menaquinone biosynthesis C-methylase UbiE